MRTFLNGRFENSVFVVLAPNGQDWLSAASRGPQMVFRHRGETEQMRRIALRYPAQADLSEAIVPDFHSFRQALNVASADQRVLVLINVPKDQEKGLRRSLRAVANAPSTLGRFHFDFEQGDAWKQNIEGTRDDGGIVLIQPGEFGMKGKVIRQLAADAKPDEIVAAMLEANSQFAESTEKKIYSTHVAKGEAAGIYFKGNVPYGEDRDGDGQIDHRGGGRRSRR